MIKWQQIQQCNVFTRLVRYTDLIVSTQYYTATNSSEVYSDYIIFYYQTCQPLCILLSIGAQHQIHYYELSLKNTLKELFFLCSNKTGDELIGMRIWNDFAQVLCCILILTDTAWKPCHLLPISCSLAFCHGKQTMFSVPSCEIKSIDICSTWLVLDMYNRVQKSTMKIWDLFIFLHWK